MEIGNIVKIGKKYFEITGNSLYESYGFLEVIALNHDTAQEVRINAESVDLVWVAKTSIEESVLPISDVSGQSEQLICPKCKTYPVRKNSHTMVKECIKCGHRWAN